MSTVSCFDALRKALCADLDFHGTDGKYASHGWHPFPAKFPPQLPKFFIEHLSDVEDIVLDPMLGLGTTLVEAMRLERRVIGCDIDPLARMIATAKLTPIEAVKTLQTGYRIIDAAKRDYWQNRNALARERNLRFDEKTREFINYWFLPQQQLELIALLQHIEAVPAHSENSVTSLKSEKDTRFPQGRFFFDDYRQIWRGLARARSGTHASPQEYQQKTKLSVCRICQAFGTQPRRVR